MREWGGVMGVRGEGVRGEEGKGRWKWREMGGGAEVVGGGLKWIPYLLLQPTTTSVAVWR